MIIGHEIRRYRDAITAGIAELVRIRSVMDAPLPGKPFGAGVDMALQHMLSLAESFGFEVKHVDGYAGHAEYGQGDELAAVLVHLDTVHEGEGWSYPPFGGVIEAGKIIGRGASDNKGPAVVALYALKTLKDLGITGNRRLRLIFGTNEESGMKDLDAYFEKEPVPDIAFVPDAGYPIFNVELGNMNVVFSQTCGHAADNNKPKLPVRTLNGGNTLTLVPAACRATLSLSHLGDVEVANLLHRIDAHVNLTAAFHSDSNAILEITAGSERIEGSSTGSPNAIANMIAFLQELGMDTGMDAFLQFLHEKLGSETDGQSLGIASSDSVSGALVVFLRTISCSSERSEVLCNIRYPVSHDGERLLSAITRSAHAYGIDVELTRHLRPVHVPESHPVIARLSRAYEKMTGEQAFLLRMGAGTYARKLRNNGVAFGAGLQGGVNTNVHGPDEFVFIDDMMRHAEICLQGMYELWID